MTAPVGTSFDIAQEKQLIGPTTETAYAGSGSSGLNGILKGVYGLLAGAISLIARTTAPTPASNGTPVNAISRLDGAQIVHLGQMPELQYNGESQQITNTSEKNIMVGSSGLRLGLTFIQVFNADTVPHTFLIRRTGAGAVLMRFTLAAGADKEMIFPQGIWGGVNTNWTAQISEAVTTTGPYVTMTGWQVPG